MSRSGWVILGIFGAMAISWWVVIATPHRQLAAQDAVTIASLNRLYPTTPPGNSAEGRDIYRANGCYYCHTQQVRPQGYGADYERGWGRRQTVARDYLYEQPVMLGTLRMGPDLSNVGVRQTNRVWFLRHLFDPKIEVPNSTMPRYAFLFEKRRKGERSSPDALPLPRGYPMDPAYEIVPKPEAKALAEYLLYLQSELPLFEAPYPRAQEPEAPEPEEAAPAADPQATAPPVAIDPSDYE